MSLVPPRRVNSTGQSMPHPEPPQPVAAPRRFSWRRLVQYRLRTLLILTTIIAVWFAWWSYTARQQRVAVAALQKAGASVQYDFRLPLTGAMDDPPQWPKWLLNHVGVDYFGSVNAVEFRGAETTDAKLEYLKGLTTLQWLDLGGAEISDAGLVDLKGLTALQGLGLGGTPVTDAGLKHLAVLKALQGLSLDNTLITDAGVEYLKKLTSLEKLDLHNTQVTDAGLKYLNSLTGLETLQLENTQVTDAGLEHLKGLIALQLLFLDGTPVTDAGVARLKQSLPNCNIRH